ncbi:Thrombospondin type-1 domain-containing protein 7A [Chelonia mydas]|uniref:Thrombospondin type-1 domain-containing protein 7A n=1 Tax=Chelonia mydas TaxID=8469 RepID=M7B679_CHEMY|nr:Thrombospondin type-1 domain-containing protein 7A [Chelonia mydas]
MTSPKGNRTRTRTIKQFPIGSESECPELEETEQCSSQGDGVAPCVTYGWRTTEWTECRVDPLLSQQDKRRGNQTALCGGGIQTREVYCVQANENLLSYLNTLKEKEGFKLRKRSITNEPTGGTGNCPHLLEAIPCEEPSCYDWRIVRLEECIPDNEKQCGPGTQVPEVVCINSDEGKEPPSEPEWAGPGQASASPRKGKGGTGSTKGGALCPVRRAPGRETDTGCWLLPRDPAADPCEALGKEEPDRGEGLWQPGLPAAEHPEEPGLPAADYPEEPGLPTADYPEEMEIQELPAADYPEEMEGPERPA